MASHPRDGAFQTSDGSTIAFTVHRAPRPDTPRMALIQATPPAMARELHDAIPQSTLVVVPGAKHLTPIECPDRIGAALVGVLRRS